MTVLHLLALWLAAALLVVLPIQAASTCPATITITKTITKEESSPTSSSPRSAISIPITLPSLGPVTVWVTRNITVSELATSTGVSTTKTYERRVISHVSEASTGGDLQSGEAQTAGKDEVIDDSIQVQVDDNVVERNGLVTSCPDAVVVTTTKTHTRSATTKTATTATGTRAFVSSSKSQGSDTRSGTHTQRSGTTSKHSQLYTESHRTSSRSKLTTTSLHGSHTSKSSAHASTLAAGDHSTAGVSGTVSHNRTTAVVGGITITLAAEQPTVVSGTTFSIGSHGASVYVDGTALAASALSGGAGVYATTSGSAHKQTTSTFVPDASKSKWNSQMSKNTCNPPCTQTIPTLTLNHAETVQYWNVTTSFCKEIDGVTYASSTTIKPPVLTLKELGFKPVKIPASVKPSDIIFPYYDTWVTSEPPFDVSVAASATACPSSSQEVSEKGGKCGPGTSHRCADMECCGADNTCGDSSAQCWEGCRRDYGSCWQNATANFLDVTDVFALPVTLNKVTVIPPDQGRGVAFAGWAYCWDCKPNSFPYPGAGAGGGAGGSRGFDGGGCFWPFCPWPSLHFGCIFNCNGDAKSPRPTKPDHPDQPTSSEPCNTPDIVLDETYGCFSQNATTIAGSTITAFVSCTETMRTYVTGCSVTATTTSIFGPSCPLTVDVSPDDDQGEEGTPNSCPYVGNTTVSPDDDQGEDGTTSVPSCPYKADISLAPLMLPATLGSMGAAQVYTLGSSAPGDILDCGGSVKKRKGGGGDPPPQYCAWVPPTKKPSATTSPPITSTLKILSPSELASLALQEIDSLITSVLSRSASLVSLISVDEASAAHMSALTETGSGLIEVISEIHSLRTQFQTWSSYGSRLGAVLFSKTRRSTKTTLPSLSLSRPPIPTLPNNSPNCISSCAIPTNTDFGKCELQITGESGSYVTTCNCSPTPTVSVPLYTICGWPACPNDAGFCPTSSPGPCLPPFMDGVGWCTQQFSSAKPTHLIGPGTSATWATCGCDTTPLTSDSVPLTSACGVQVCPNQIASIDTNGFSFYGWGMDCVFNVPTDTKYDDCTRTAVSVSGASTSWRCDCNGKRPSVTSLCNTPVCPNEVEAIFTSDGSLVTQVHVGQFQSSSPDYGPPSPSVMAPAGSICTSPASVSGLGNCTLETVLEHSSTSLVCNCPSAEVGVVPSLTTACGTTMCPNQVATWNAIPSSLRATSGHAERDATSQAAWREWVGYNREVATTPATPGSTPRPMARDTSTPAQPTSLVQVSADIDGWDIAVHQRHEQVSTEVDGWDIAVQQEHERTTAHSELPEQAAVGASGVARRIMSWF